MVDELGTSLMWNADLDVLRYVEALSRPLPMENQNVNV